MYVDGVVASDRMGSTELCTACVMAYHATTHQHPSYPFFQQQLDVQLVAADDSSSASGPTRLGLIQLTDLEVNAAALNGYLEGRPMRLVRGRVARVEVRVCYEKLLTEEGLKITLEGLDLLLAAAPPASGAAPAGAAGVAASRRRRQSAPSSSDEDGEGQEGEEEAGDAGRGARGPPRSTQGRAGDMEADSATGIIADWIEQMAAQMRVEVKGLTVRVLGSAEEGPLLRLDVAKLGYEDVTARYQGRGALSASSMAASGGEGAGAPPTAAHPPSCVSHKVCTVGFGERIGPDGPGRIQYCRMLISAHR